MERDLPFVALFQPLQHVLGKHQNVFGHGARLLARNNFRLARRSGGAHRFDCCG
jgi:hypothetical protein